MAGINWDSPGKPECMVTLPRRAPTTFRPPPTDTASPAAFSNESWFLSNVQHYHRPVGKVGVLHATSKPFLLLLPSKTPDSLDSTPLDFRPPAPDSHCCSDRFPFTLWGLKLLVTDLPSTPALPSFTEMSTSKTLVFSPVMVCPCPLSHLLWWPYSRDGSPSESLISHFPSSQFLPLVATLLQSLTLFMASNLLILFHHPFIALLHELGFHGSSLWWWLP